tara:strand:+ start:793 stop:1197 length:405 start_codon:yes stop_codon:yes gene_type:complete
MMSLVSTLIGPVTGLLDKVIKDKDQTEKLAHEIATLAGRQAHEANMAQVEVNKAEAKHRSLFVAGWRPFVGWICAVALLYHFVLNPIILFSLTVAGVDIPALPEFDMGSLMTLLLGILGLGGYRSYEKKLGITK